MATSRFTFALLTISLWVLGYSSPIRAQALRRLTYQASITKGGVPLEGDHTIQISLYDSRIDGSLLFRDHFTTSVQQGVLNLIIGSGQAIPDSLTFEKPYYLALAVDGAPELDRTALTAVPYALNASSADVASALSSGFYYGDTMFRV